MLCYNADCYMLGPDNENGFEIAYISSRLGGDISDDTC